MLLLKCKVLWSTKAQLEADKLGIESSEEDIETGYHTMNLRYITLYNSIDENKTIVRFIDGSYSHIPYPVDKLDKLLSEIVSPGISGGYWSWE